MKNWWINILVVVIFVLALIAVGTHDEMSGAYDRFQL